MVEENLNIDEKTAEIEKKLEEARAVPKYRTLPGVFKYIPVIAVVITILMSINWTFDLRFFCNVIMEEYTFYYLIVGLIAPMSFMYIPVSKKASREMMDVYFWFDMLIALLICASNIYLAINAYNIYTYGWEIIAPKIAVIISVFLWVCYIEMARRSGGNAITIVILLFSALPLYTQYLPGILNGISKTFLKTAQMHILGTDSGMGTLIRTFCSVVLPYTIFGTVIVGCGGGEFFLRLAMQIFGRFRGGMAKVAVASSALFGSISGNPVVNVMTTGCVTIPAMKESGFDSNMAGAVEATASTAGTMTPPIMGTASFVMASMLGISYSEVALGAIFPILMYYICVFFSIDFYSHEKGLVGMKKEEIPSMKLALSTGWFFIPTMAVLIYFIFFKNMIPEAALFSSALAVILVQFDKRTRFNKERIFKMLKDIGTNCLEVMGVMLGVGFIMGSFSMTGLGVSFPHAMYVLANGNVILLVFLTALTSFIMGMGMTTICCYIFLAVTMAPALTQAGLNQFAVHMFILYCGMLSYITPPVAVATIPAAMISGGDGMKIGMKACKIGMPLFLLPFLFIANPALLLHDANTLCVIKSMLFATLAAVTATQAMNNHFFGMGRPNMNKTINIIFRVLMVIGCISFGMPGTTSDVVGVILIAATLIPIYVFFRGNKKKTEAI